MQLIKVQRPYTTKEGEHKTATDLYVVLSNGYKVRIKPAFDNKADYRDLYREAVEANSNAE